MICQNRMNMIHQKNQIMKYLIMTKKKLKKLENIVKEILKQKMAFLITKITILKIMKKILNNKLSKIFSIYKISLALIYINQMNMKYMNIKIPKLNKTLKIIQWILNELIKQYIIQNKIIYLNFIIINIACTIIFLHSILI